MTGSRIQAWLLATALLLAPAAVQAQQDAIRSNCRSDFMKNCSGVTPGGREALECLMKNKANVSGGCQGALNAVAAPAPAAAAKSELKLESKSESKSESKTESRPEPKAQSATSAPEAPKAPPPSAARPTAPKAAAAPAHPAAPAPAAAAAPGPAAAPDAASRPMRLGEAIVIRRFCFNDFKALCKGIQIGQGRAVKCLADNQPALSPGCRQAMAKAGY